MTQGGTLSIFQAQVKRFCNQNWNGTNPAVQQRMAPGLDGANPSNSDQATLFNEQAHQSATRQKLMVPTKWIITG